MKSLISLLLIVFLTSQIPCKILEMPGDSSDQNALPIELIAAKQNQAKLPANKDVAQKLTIPIMPIIPILDLTQYEKPDKKKSDNQVSALLANTPLKNTNLYDAANYIWATQNIFPYCQRCQSLSYISFRAGNSYLTAKTGFLQFQTNTALNPINSQLFVAQQQIDGSWAFKSLTQNLYIRASDDNTTINYQTYVGPWQRWYMQRHGPHVHIQSAQFIYHWWVIDSSKLKQYNGAASQFIVEYWPQLQWLWNW